MAFEFDDSIDPTINLTIVGLGEAAHHALKTMNQHRLPCGVDVLTLAGAASVLSGDGFDHRPDAVCILCELTSVSLLDSLRKTAALAKRRGALVFALISIPGLRESGFDRGRNHTAGVVKLITSVDFPIVFSAQESRQKFISGMFWICHWIQLCHQQTWISIDFADLKACSRYGEIAMLGAGVGYGENRAKDAVRDAVGAGLLQIDTAISTARGVLVSIEGSSSLRMDEYEIIVCQIDEMVSEDALIVTGLHIDEQCGEELKVKTFFSGIKEQ